jgi:small conductance mechanosensitive channel
MDERLTTVSEYVTLYGMRLLAALAIFVIGKWAAQIVARLLDHSFQRAKVEPTLGSFVKNLTYCALLIFVVIASLAQLGIQTTSIVALVGAAGLAIGLALQGSLSNFAAGVLIIVFHPFRVGDFIEAAGTKGTVTEIQIFHTALTLLDTRKQIVPNSAIMSGTITVGRV